ncbi:MAG TPA: hypothetical protein PK400_05335 [Phycisphaerales bacterium]|nr:hypothetical protein [Phycisphaerales bacterium]HRQ75304.1 hypothetical protein [Phycisphaerales bacterium]
MRTLLLALMLATLCSCRSPEEAPPPHVYPGGVVPRGEVPPWPYWPADMRFHPLTRLATTEGGNATGILGERRESHEGELVHVEARLEFFDTDRHTSRSLGQVRFELRDGAQGQASDVIDAWNIDMRDLVVNAQLFDPITRTYLIRLELERASVPEHADLRAYFLGVDGAELRASHRLRVR